MTGPSIIARLSGGGRIWALGALLGDDDALEALARAVLSRWQPGDRVVVLGNMLGPNGDPAGTLDGLLGLDHPGLRRKRRRRSHRLPQWAVGDRPLDEGPAPARRRMPAMPSC
jgi:hypothetical protein